MAMLGGGAALALAIMLSGCGSKKEEKAVNATTAASGNATDAATTAGAADHDMDANAMDEQMQRHHQQQMDHDAMRNGNMGNSTAPAAAPPADNQAMPMKDM
ncbi:hypothetical protein [Tardiphaga sp.]|uniref:hypothetical protein n=1 Tax=Tardiphaga sp. TaxID=1926292 RepID=UPI00352B005F